LYYNILDLTGFENLVCKRNPANGQLDNYENAGFPFINPCYVLHNAFTHQT